MTKDFTIQHFPFLIALEIPGKMLISLTLVIRVLSHGVQKKSRNEIITEVNLSRQEFYSLLLFANFHSLNTTCNSSASDI